MRSSPFNAGLMSDFTYQSDLQKPLTPEEQRGMDMHEQMHKEIYEDHVAGQELEKLEAVELPEPIGGHRANMITFHIRSHLHGIDKRLDWESLRRKEQAYHGIRELSRAAFVAGRQTGKTVGNHDKARDFLTNWLNYIEQINQEPRNGR